MTAADLDRNRTAALANLEKLKASPTISVIEKNAKLFKANTQIGIATAELAATEKWTMRLSTKGLRVIGRMGGVILLIDGSRRILEWSAIDAQAKPKMAELGSAAYQYTAKLFGGENNSASSDSASEELLDEARIEAKIKASASSQPSAHGE